MNYNNTVVEAITEKHSKQIIDFYVSLGYKNPGFLGDNTKDKGRPNRYYGVYEENFSFFDPNFVENHLKIICLPQEYFDVDKGEEFYIDFSGTGIIIPDHCDGKVFFLKTDDWCFVKYPYARNQYWSKETRVDLSDRPTIKYEDLVKNGYHKTNTTKETMQTITRAGLKDLYDNAACTSWKIVIDQLMEEASWYEDKVCISEELIIKAFDEADSTKKKKLKKYFKQPEEPFNSSMLGMGEMMRLTDRARMDLPGHVFLGCYNGVAIDLDSTDPNCNLWSMGHKLLGEKLPPGYIHKVIAK